MRKNRLCFFYKKGASYSCLLLIGLLFTSCKDFIEVDELNDKLLAGQVFDTPSAANAATAGIYRLMRVQPIASVSLPSTFINSTSFYNCMVSDEIVAVSPNTAVNYINNTLSTGDTQLPWQTLYNIIYSTNAALEGLSVSKNLEEKHRIYYTAEAKFCRALCYFYLVNLYGDVPLVLTTDVNSNSTISRSPVSDVNAQILKDLEEAQPGLGDDYSFTGGDKDRANRWAAAALLARMYLYQQDWAKAEELASAVINSGQYSLLDGPAGILNRNNTEAILQLSNNGTDQIPLVNFYLYTAAPTYVCTDFLLNAFEPGDERFVTWLRTNTVGGVSYSTPFKFTSSAVTAPEWFTLIRLAEMYLIRAEARAMQHNFTAAIADVNLIREKHGRLAPLTAPGNQEDALDIVLHERQVDLFTEGAHRDGSI